jgi:glycosyltransferase involved in cell wall biosynthesis
MSVSNNVATEGDRGALRAAPTQQRSTPAALSTQHSIGLALDRLDRRRHHIFAIWLEGLVRRLSPLAPNLSVIRLRTPGRPMDFGGTRTQVLPRLLENHYAYALLAPRYFDGLGLDLVHFPFLFAPYAWGRSKAARVVTIHGSARNEMPYEMRKRFGAGKLVRMRHALERYDAVLAVSESAKREACEFYGLAPDRVTVVYDAIGDQFRPGSADPAVLGKYGVGRDGRPYVLSLCTLRPKKNVGTTVAAFAELKRRGLPHQLVLVGDKAPSYTEVDERIAEHGLGGDVVQTGFVPAAEVPEFHRGADLLLFPSFHEGFGLPVAEAMCSGVPVVATNAYAIPEVAGGAALLVDDPRDVAEVAEKAYRVLADDALRASMIERGLARGARFRWDVIIDDYMSAYGRAIDASSARRRP